MCAPARGRRRGAYPRRRTSAVARLVVRRCHGHGSLSARSAPRAEPLRSRRACRCVDEPVRAAGRERCAGVALQRWRRTPCLPPVGLCYSGHATAMGRNSAQRVRADERCRYSSASFFALHSLLRCAPLLRLTCVPLPLPRWLACLVQRSAQHARCARPYAVASCRPASAARTALHSVRPPRRNPPLTTCHASQRLRCALGVS